MIELGVGMQILRGIGWAFLVAALLALVAAFVLPTTRRRKALWVGIVLVVFVGPSLPSIFNRVEYRYRYAKAKKVFDERCKSAGEKIFRVVEGVEGIKLLNMRTGTQAEREGDPQWSGAGLPDDGINAGYIANLLEWEHDSRGGSKRGYLNSSPEGAIRPGFRFVEVLQNDGTYRRFRLNKARSSIEDYVVGEPSIGSTTRFAVKYDDITLPEDRQHWVAGARVTVLDTVTGEILGLLTAFSFEPGLGSREGARQPWRFAKTCPVPARGNTHYATRFFVDQVVKPARGD